MPRLCAACYKHLSPNCRRRPILREYTKLLYIPTPILLTSHALIIIILLLSIFSRTFNELILRSSEESSKYIIHNPIAISVVWVLLIVYFIWLSVVDYLVRKLGMRLQKGLDELLRDLYALIHNADHHQVWDEGRAEEVEVWEWKYRSMVKELKGFEKWLKECDVREDKKAKDKAKREAEERDRVLEEGRTEDEAIQEPIVGRMWRIPVLTNVKERYQRWIDDRETKQWQNATVRMVGVMDWMRWVVAARKKLLRLDAENLYFAGDTEPGSVEYIDRDQRLGVMFKNLAKDMEEFWDEGWAEKCGHKLVVRRESEREWLIWVGRGWYDVLQDGEESGRYGPVALILGVRDYYNGRY